MLRAGLRQRGKNLFCLISRHLFLSAQARLGNMQGYYQPSLRDCFLKLLSSIHPGVTR
jgi:hypothetical protein